MTDQVNLESAQPVSPGPTPTGPHGAGSGQATSPDIGAVLAEMQDLRKQVQGLQAVGDKREAKLAERFTTVEDYLTRVGLKPDPQIIREMQVDEILASRNSQHVVSPGSGASVLTPQPSAIDYLTPVKAVGLDANDNEVLALMVKHHRDQTAFNTALINLKAQRLNQPPPSAAALPAPSGGVAKSGSPDISGITDPRTLMAMAYENSLKLPPRKS